MASEHVHGGARAELVSSGTIVQFPVFRRRGRRLLSAVRHPLSVPRLLRRPEGARVRGMQSHPAGTGSTGLHLYRQRPRQEPGQASGTDG